MVTELLERSFVAARQALVGVRPEQLDDATPCASWDVRTLIAHVVGGTHWFAESTRAGVAPTVDEAQTAALVEGDYVATFDDGVRKVIAAFGEPGAQEKMIKLPFGEFTGAAFMGLVTSEALVHAWDLARATGQSTDLDPELAREVLAGAKASIADNFRGDDPDAPFGPEREAPPGASPADELAAYLGRQV